MGKRLSKIYTRTGDRGETGLGDGSRVSKSSHRIEAIGAMDELNSALGLTIEVMKQDDTGSLSGTLNFLEYCQHRVFDAGGELSIPGFEILTSEHVSTIEARLDELNSELAPLENFILPAGSVLIAQCHMARSICRRAERRLVALGETENINPVLLLYLNRLSDYLFVVARYVALKSGVDEVLWTQG